MPANYGYFYNLGGDHQEPREDEPFLHLLWGEEDGMVSSSSSSSASSSPHHSPVLQDMSEEEEEEAADGDSDTSHSPPSAPPSPLVLAVPGGSSQHEEGAAGGQAPPEESVHEKMAEVVEFLLLKYRAGEPTTVAEMLREVLGDDQEYFPVAFRQACECLQLVFGLDVQEADPGSDCYIVTTALGLTYDGLLSPDETMPKTGLLVIVLAVILLRGNRSSEERMWEALGVMGVYAGMEHFIFGEPRELLTQAWVQEQYLEYRQVADSDPPCYEFLWGPRAHAETNKMEVLEHLLKVNKRESISLLALSRQAASNMEEEA